MNHKTALVSAMSIAGVMLAGATALGANLGILGASQDVGDLSAVDTTLAVEPTTTMATLPQPEITAYQINGVGTVNIVETDGVLSLGSIDVGAWTYAVAPAEAGLAMTFSFEGREVKFSATIVDGQVYVEVWEDQVLVQRTGGVPAPAAVSPDTTAVTAPSEGESEEKYEEESEEEYEDEHESEDESEYRDNHEDEDKPEDRGEESREDEGGEEDD